MPKRTDSPLGALDQPPVTKIGARLEYPSRYAQESGQWIMFDRYKYKKANINSPAQATKAEGSSTIALPIPPQLVSNYSVTWANQSLGIAGNQVANAGGAVVDSLRRIMSGAGSVSDLGGIAKEAVKGTPQYLFNQFVDAATDSSLGERVLMAAGVARNPHQAAVFQSPNFRQFDFSWKLFPKNEEESDTIKDIIAEFRTGMAPSFLEGGVDGVSFQDNIFEYPDMWQINFADDDHLFKIHFCVLANVNVDYHGESMPKYFNTESGKKPSSIILNVQFQEIKILTRKDISKGY